MNIKAILVFCVMNLLSPLAIAGSGHDHGVIQPASLMNSEQGVFIIIGIIVALFAFVLWWSSKKE